MKPKIETVPLKNLKTTLFVRAAINQDNVLMLATLMENGTELDPIKVTPEMEVIDGRHRIEAHELLNRTEIRVEIVHLKNELDMISEGFTSNLGGALPPTQADIEHTVGLLLERKVGIGSIAARLHLPPGMVRSYVNNVKSKIARTKLMNAVNAVVEDGLTAPKAAEKFGVELGKLKSALSGAGPKPTKEIPDILRALTYNFKSNSSKTASVIRKLLEKFEDGDVTLKQMREIFEHIDQLQKRSNRSLADWKKRFDALNKGKA